MASGLSTRAGDVPEIEFTLGAGILVDPSSAYVGDRLPLPGGGFAPGETGIRVTLDGQVAATSPLVQMVLGNPPLALPASAYGPHTVSASGDVTKTAATASLSTLAKIIAVSPIQGAPGDLVSLTGAVFPIARANSDCRWDCRSENMVPYPMAMLSLVSDVPKGSMEGTRMLVATDGAELQTRATSR